MTQVYRILRAAYAGNAFDGEGAYRYGGRWSNPGTRLCYTSEHQSLAMLEYFVHLDSNDAPDDLVLVTAEVPADLSRAHIAVGELPADWFGVPAPPALARLGDEFAQRGEHAILVVPSALAASENNWLLNPGHPDFKEILAHAPQPLRYDLRMFTKRQGRGEKPR